MNLDELRREGVTRPARTLSRDELGLIRRHLAGCQVYNAHMARQASERPQSHAAAIGARRWSMFSHHMHDVLRAPVLLPLAIELTALAQAYFEEPALLFSLNAYWTQPATGRYEQTHKWHRDGDDRKFLALLIYGTDILSPDDGAHCWIPGTQAFPDGADLPADWKKTERRILGPAGTMFFTNGRNFHLGLRPTRRPRLLLWIRWGVSDPPRAYEWDQLTPVPAAELAPGVYPADPELRQAIRLVVK